MLLAFEAAEYEGDAASRRAALTFAIVGGGPTGVELASAIKEIAGHTLPREYRNIESSRARWQAKRVVGFGQSSATVTRDRWRSSDETGP
jgi:hypothetical protein